MSQVLNRSAQAEMTGYIVRAGTDPRLGLSEDVLGRFATEGEAQQAFLALRLSPVYRHGWAELLAVGDGRTPMPLRWFGDRSPSGAPASPPHRERPRTTQSRVDLVGNRRGPRQLEQERTAAPASDLDRPRRRRRTRAVTAVVAVLAAVTLAIGADAGDTPTEQPVSTRLVVP